MSGIMRAAVFAAFTVSLLPCRAATAGAQETTLLNHRGAAVAYIDHGGEDTVFLWKGTPVAYLVDDSLYGFNGRHLGWFEDGVVRDHRGLKAGLTEERIETALQASTPKGPKLPVPHRQHRELPPVRPAFTDVISPLTLEALLFRGRGPQVPY